MAISRVYRRPSASEIQATCTYLGRYSLRQVEYSVLGTRGCLDLSGALDTTGTPLASPAPP